MEVKEIQMILDAQRKYFASGATLSVSFRREMLKKLKAAIAAYQDKLFEALKADLGKSDFESFMCEIGLVNTEISYMLRHTKGFAKRRLVYTPLPQFASASYKQPTPRGNVLIMSPWNYPFLLTIEPLVDAIAAGNTAMVKPSAYSPNTSAVMAQMLESCFDKQYVAVVTGGRAENTHLLEQKFDLIFFTGSQNVGKEVLRKAAENLTPCVLELGGKSPCIVDSSAKIKLAAKRIVWGKFLNCGQTCVAPDYILCERSVKEKLIAALKTEIHKQFGENPLSNPNFGKIITEKHFNRVSGLIDPAKVVCGGETNSDTMQIAPTVMDNVTWEDAVMGEEIFGPVLPILTFDSFDEIYGQVERMGKPLALYLYSENKKHIRAVEKRCRYGGGCINDCIIHLATSEMGFGGVGESGMGTYHGKLGFDTFSHIKSIVNKKTWMDLPMRYQPFKKFYGTLLHIFLR